MRDRALARFMEYFRVVAPGLMRAGSRLVAREYGETSVIEILPERDAAMDAAAGWVDGTGDLLPLYDVVLECAGTAVRQACFFSGPTAPHMYKVNCLSRGGTLCHLVHVTVYDSLDVMGMDLLAERERKAGLGRTLFMLPRRRLLAAFLSP